MASRKALGEKLTAAIISINKSAAALGFKDTQVKRWSGIKRLDKVLGYYSTNMAAVAELLAALEKQALNKELESYSVVKLRKIADKVGKDSKGKKEEIIESLAEEFGED